MQPFLISRSKQPLFAALALFALLVGQIASAADLPAGIQVSVKLKQETVAPTEKILATFTFTNTSSQTIRFLKWGTPLEGRLNENSLIITLDGEELPYTGRHYKRARPIEEDFIRLPPQQSVQATVNLLTAYEIEYAGEYLIQLRNSGTEKLDSVSNKSKLLKLVQTGDRDLSFKRTPTVNNCPNGVAGLPNNRFSLIDLAVADAESIAAKALVDLTNTPIGQRVNALRYKEWFGVYEVGRWNKVQSNFGKIFNTIRSQVITFVCDDTESAFAYVFPNQPFSVFLGRAFWSAPRLGTDSKAGTVIHEMSHFDVLGGTDDHVYGQSSARNLANSNPNLAANNADSQEYFAENTPFLAMPPPGSDPEPDPKIPDLVISTVSTTNQNPRANRTVGMTAAVSNVGQSQSASTQATLRLSNDELISLTDLELERALVPALNAGTTNEFIIDFKAPDENGQFWVGVCVLPVDDETKTDNNCSIGVPLMVERVTVIAPLLLLLLDEDEDE